MTNQASGVAEPDDAVLVSGATVYVLNSNSTNRWSANVQPGNDDDGKRISDEECRAIAESIRAALATKPAATADVVARLQALHDSIVPGGSHPNREWGDIRRDGMRDGIQHAIAALRTPAQAPSTGAVGYARRMDIEDFPTQSMLIARKAEDDWSIPVYLAPPVVQPASPAVEVAECSQCVGTGTVEAWDKHYQTFKDCTACNGTGTPPAPAAVTEGASRREIVDLLTSAAWQLKQHASDCNHVSSRELPGKLIAAATAIAAAPHPVVAVPGPGSLSAKLGALADESMERATAEQDERLQQYDLGMATAYRYAAQTVVTAPGSLTAEQVAGLLSQFEVATVRCAQMHREYLGKAMSDQTYNAFATLRDDTIPALRKRLIAALATTSTAAQPESGVKP